MRQEQTDAGLEVELTTDDALAVYRSITAETATAARNRALLAALWRVGMRPGEALAVCARDVDLADGCIRLGTRVIGLDALSCEAFADWMEYRMANGLAPELPFISTLRGKGLAQAYVRELLPRLAEGAGVTVRMHGMGLRYLCAREMVAEGIALEVIQAQLDAWPTSSITRFLPHPADEELLVAVASRPDPRV